MKTSAPTGEIADRLVRCLIPLLIMLIREIFCWGPPGRAEDLTGLCLCVNRASPNRRQNRPVQIGKTGSATRFVIFLHKVMLMKKFKPAFQRGSGTES